MAAPRALLPVGALFLLRFHHVGAVDVPAAEGAHVKCDLADFLRTASVEDFLWNSLLADFLEYIFNYGTQISRERELLHMAM